MHYKILLSEVDRNQLPSEDRHKKGEEFEEAVCKHLLSQHKNNPKPVAALVRDGVVTVGDVPDIDEAIELLSSGNTKDGIALCDLILSEDKDDFLALLNSGMALSDLGQMDEALLRLVRAFAIEGTANTAVAIGVAHARNKDDQSAAVWLKQALELEPKNPYALRNLGGILLKTGKFKEALCMLDALALENPTDQHAQFAFGQALLANGMRDKADEILEQAIALAPYSPIADTAREARSQIAQETFREKGGGADAPRMDAMMYLLDAIQTFDLLPVDQQEAIFHEVAIIGMRGLDVNDPEQKYTLRSIPGKKLSGLHMVCFMWVGGKRFTPDADMGFDLTNEYAAAMSLAHPPGKIPGFKSEA